jgi:peptide/nickel transport system ATP-binding protein/oligopeptide transport system ATP-binding protein
MPLLHVENLHTHFITRAMDNRIRVAKALNGVDFTVEAGETLGLVGETGAGKSLTALSIMGLLRPPARVVEGAAKFEGKDLISMRPAELNRVRGSRIGMVVQNPRSSLDPTATVGVQLMRVLRAHSNISVREAERRSVDMLNAVGIPDPTRRMTAWPHEFSGGMAQRVLIAMALINRPSLLIADEPTTGLDVTVQSQVLELLRQFSQSGGMSTLIITHDLGIIAHFCDRRADRGDRTGKGRVRTAPPSLHAVADQLDAIASGQGRFPHRTRRAAEPLRARRGMLLRLSLPPRGAPMRGACLRTSSRAWTHGGLPQARRDWTGCRVGTHVNVSGRAAYASPFRSGE